MRNLAITICLAALAGNACAGWTVLDKGETQTTYVDKDAIQSSAGSVKMWVMVSGKEVKSLPDGSRYLSTVLLYEFDCSGQRNRVLQSSAYAAPLRQGTQVFTFSSPGEWSYNEPGTVNELVLQTACKKR